jgi:DNA-binding CsgD family transcriptional regulator
MPTASRTISQRIADAAGRDFVGRREELSLLRAAAEAGDAPVLVAFVHGPGGIGKSRLLEAAAGTLSAGVTVLRLDSRRIEPTPAGLLAAIAEALGAPRAGADLGRVARLVRGIPGRVVLTLDTYERLAILDTWVRQALLPAMPDSLLTIIAGRDPPVAGWLTTPGWRGLVRELHLGPLGQGDAILMLRSRGLGELPAARANAFARGHPLALELAAAALRDDPDLRIETGPPPVVIERLLDALVADLPESTIEPLEAASTTRRVTEPILRALLDREDVRAEFDALRRLPFVELTRDGLVLHDVVREVIATDLAARDPEAHARYRRRAWRYFADRAHRPRPDGLWEVTADLIYLIRNPVLRNACFPAGSSGHAVEPAVPPDGAAILEITAAHEAPGPAVLLGRWWATHPESFAVARGTDGAVGAFVQVAEISGLDAALLESDPVARAWAGHLAASPPREGDRTLAMRRWLGRDSGEMLSPAVGSCWLDVKRVYMELRPRLSRLYSVMSDFEALAPIFVPLGFAPVGDPVDVGGVRHQPVWLDFGEGSVDGWLARLVAAELGAAEDAVLAVPRDEGVEALTPREREVLALIAEGLSNRAIGRRLVISEKTAGNHVSHLFSKLGVRNRAQATRIAVECGVGAKMRDSPHGEGRAQS